MSRSGYCEDYDWDEGQANLYRGAVASAIRGKRGQTFLREMLAAMDALPEKKLIAGELETANGAVCAIGALGKARKIDMANIDPEDAETVAHLFGISDKLAREVVYTNDEWFDRETPEHRFEKMRAWIITQIRWEPGTAETIKG
jgi:hypothetical protein